MTIQLLSRVTLEASMKKKKMVRKSQTSPNQNQGEGFFSFQRNFLAYTKGVVRAKLAVCDWGLLQLGSNMQKGSFFSFVSDHGGVLF